MERTELQRRLAARLRPKEPTQYTRLNFRLDTPLAEKMKSQAQARGMSLTKYLEWLLEQHS